MQKIVIAEDDKLLIGSLEQAFREAGFDVTTAVDGEDALAKIRSEKPHIVLLDVMMPKLDGLGVVWEMKADPLLAGIPAVILTNMGDVDTISKIMSAGGTDYLLKSDHSVDMIIQKIQEVLSRQHGDVAPMI